MTNQSLLSTFKHNIFLIKFLDNAALIKVDICCAHPSGRTERHITCCMA